MNKFNSSNTSRVSRTATGSGKRLILATAIALASAIGISAPLAHAGGTYAFTVSCPNKRLVVEWRTGAIDPGREYLRIASGTSYPGCSVSNYNAATDSNLPREKKKGAGAIFDGLGPLTPFFGGLLGGLF